MHPTDPETVEKQALRGVQQVRGALRPLLPVGGERHRCGQPPLLHLLPGVVAWSAVVAHIRRFQLLVACLFAM